MRITYDVDALGGLRNHPARHGKNALPPGIPARRSPSRRWLTALVLLLACAASAAAQTNVTQDVPDLTTMSLDQLLDAEVVFAAAKREQTLREAPSAVTVVTAAEIRQHGYRTLADVLRSLPSFYVTYDRNYSYVGVRGFDRPGDYSTRVLLLLNGLRTNDNVYEQAYVGNTFPLDMDLVDRIEVVRGPSAAIYGNSAFFAVVNVVTKTGRELQGGELSASAASFGTMKGRFTWGRRFDSGFEVLLSGTLSDSKGQRLYYREFDTPLTNDGIADHLDGERFGSLFASLARGSFCLEASHVSREKGVPTASFETLFGDARTRTRDAKDMVSLTYQKSSGQRSSLTARLHYGLGEYRGIYVYGDDADVQLNNDSSHGQWWGLETSLVRSVSTRHLLSFGAEFQHDFRQRQLNFDEDSEVVYLDSRNASVRGALFAQDEFQATEALTLHLGLRHDWYKTFGHQTSPRAALIWGDHKPTTVKLLYGHAFRAPNDFELHYTGVLYKTNPLLQPERIRTMEVVLERTLRPGLRVNASAYLNRIEHLISLQRDPADGLLHFQNVDEMDGAGVELGLQFKPDRGASGRLSYSLQRSHDHADGEELTNSPRHAAKLDLLVPLPGKRLTAGIDAQYLSARRTPKGGRAGSFLVANLTLTATRIFGNLDLSASMYNLFDERYSDPGSEEHLQDAIEQDGRNVRLKLVWRF